MSATLRLQALLASHLVGHWSRTPPTVLARLLRPLSGLYRGLLALQRAAYASGLRQPIRAPVPLIVVGNLIAGGAGKTPAVMHLVSLLRRSGWTPGVVARGYGGAADGATRVQRDSLPERVGDEPLLVHLRTAAPVAVARRRIDAARLLCVAEPGIDILIADDGLQHRALARDLEVIVFDERGVGNGLLLPAGPLREPQAADAPPHSVVLYNAGQPTTRWPGYLATRRLAGAVPLADWWRGASPRIDALHALRGRRVRAVAGLAVPQRFFDMLRAEGLDIDTLTLPDHYDYRTLPWPADSRDVIVTEKDAVKLPVARVGATQVWVAALDFVPEAGFDTAVLRALPQRPAKP